MPVTLTDTGLDAQLEAEGAPRRSVTVVQIGITEVQSLVSPHVQVGMTYLDDESVEAAALGDSIYQLAVAKYVTLSSSGVLSRPSELAHHENVVCAFVHATLQELG